MFIAPPDGRKITMANRIYEKPNKVPRVLFVHSQLKQHGSEKLMYELARILKKNSIRFDVLTRPFFINNQYYFPLFKSLGSNIIKRLITMRHFTFLFRRYRNQPSHPITKFLRFIYKKIAYALYGQILEKYDRVIVIGMETYCDTVRFVNCRKDHIFVHHVMHAVQQERDYLQEYDLNHVIILDEQQRYELSNGAKQLKLSLFPLPVDFKDKRYSGRALTWKAPCFRSKIKIGVVSRVKKDRPNEPIFVHFSWLLREFDAELHFFGDGDPDIYSELINNFGIPRSSIIFHGHTASIRESFYKNGISIAWSVTMAGSISYAAIDMIALGIPVFFINIGEPKGQTSGPNLEFSNSKEGTLNFHRALKNGTIVLDDVRRDQLQFVKARFDSASLSAKLMSIYGL